MISSFSLPARRDQSSFAPSGAHRSARPPVHVAWLLALALTRIVVSPAQASGDWTAWSDAFVRLAADPALSDVSRASVQAKLSGIASVQPDPRSRCGETLTAADTGSFVQKARVDLLGATPEGCDQARFGMASFTLSKRSPREFEALEAKLEARFGPPAVTEVSGERRLRWQVNEGCAVELERAVRRPEREPIGITLANVPEALRPKHKTPAERL